MRLSSLLCGLGVGLAAVAAWPAVASASPEFPGAIQEAANMPCVPTCLLCHTSSPGTSSTWQTKQLPQTLASAADSAGNPILKEGDEDSLKAAYAVYAKMYPDGAALVSQGKDPQPVAGVRSGADVCGPTYGCGATIAAHTRGRRTNPESAVAAALALLAGLLVMRRRRR